MRGNQTEGLHSVLVTVCGAGRILCAEAGRGTGMGAARGVQVNYFFAGCVRFGVLIIIMRGSVQHALVRGGVWMWCSGSHYYSLYGHRGVLRGATHGPFVPAHRSCTAARGQPAQMGRMGLWLRVALWQVPSSSKWLCTAFFVFVLSSGMHVPCAPVVDLASKSAMVYGTAPFGVVGAAPAILRGF